MKIASLFLTLCFITSSHGVFASRTLQQARAPAPGPAQGQCAVGALQAAGNYTTLLSLVAAASQSTTLISLLSNSSQVATVFAPTDSGVQNFLTSNGLTANSLLSNSTLITLILQYHITGSQLAAENLQEGASFPTLYNIGNVPQNITVSGQGLSSTVRGTGSSAGVAGRLTTCNFVVYPINGLLLTQAWASALLSGGSPAGGPRPAIG
jgi:uncharacterized surface protein with fasciclin (FAS1) repeats